MCCIKIFSLILILFLTGCMIGPKYVRPTAAIPTAYKESKDWKEATPSDAELKGNWWEIFNDARLNELEAQVNVSNQNIVAAQAQYAQSYALVQAAKSAFFPILTTDASYTRAHAASGSNGRSATSQTLLNANVSWELDLWGKIRQEIQANKASAQASAAELENAKLSSQSQLAQDYFELSSVDTQKQILDNTLSIYQKFLSLTKNRYAGGVAGQTDVIQAQTQVDSTRAAAIDLGVQRSQLEHAMAVLIGKPASDFSLPNLSLPQSLPQIPVGLPSALLERRPDIASAERMAAQANALIGVAQTAYFPTLSLSAAGSYESSNLSNLFSSPNPLWSVGPALAETIFDAGLRQAQTAQARAVYDEDVANYRQTVLTAISQVEDNLAAIRILEQESKLEDDAVADSKKALELETNQYKAGTVSALDVINTQATLLTNEKAQAAILGERFNASVLLIEYLGGGWKD